MNNQQRNPVAALTNKKTNLYIADLPAVVGRNDTSVDVYFFHESVSREHCIFECINHRVTIRDLGSTVGTAVNGVKLEPNIPYNIEDGAKITIGKVKFVFHADYEEIARRERMQVNNVSPDPAPVNNMGSPTGGADHAAAGAARAPKVVTVSARELTEYEYGEDEVIFIDCGLEQEHKPVSFTSQIRKSEIEEAINNEADAKESKSLSLCLSWTDEETGKDKKIEIDQFPFSVGRKSDENDYALRKKGVSRKHFHLEESDGECFIIDDKSTNGVKVNGTKIKAEEKTKLKDGDSISIADVTFTVRFD